MIKNICTIAFASLFITVKTFAQTVKEKIEQSIKDPKAKENAAKADVYIQDKTKLTDSATIRKEEAVTNQKKRAKKYCKQKASK